MVTFPNSHSLKFCNNISQKELCVLEIAEILEYRQKKPEILQNELQLQEQQYTIPFVHTSITQGNSTN